MWAASRIAAFAALSLAACSSSSAETPLDKAERHYRYLNANHGSIEDLCAAAQEGKKAAVDANADQVTFLTWQSRASLTCTYGQRTS